MIQVNSNAGFRIGETIVIARGTPIEETNIIKGFGSIILEYPLKFDHPIGTNIDNKPITPKSKIKLGLIIGGIVVVITIIVLIIILLKK